MKKMTGWEADNENSQRSEILSHLGKAANKDGNKSCNDLA